MSTPNFSINKALADIEKLYTADLITAEARRGAERVVTEVFTTNSVYASIGPDDDGVTFYWVAGDRSIEIDLDECGEVFWGCIRRGDGQRHIRESLTPEFRAELASFSRHVEAVNPDWERLVTR